MLDVKVRINNKKVKKMLDDFSMGLPRKADQALGRAAQWAQMKILQRTGKGTSVTGSPFIAYTKSYNKFKSERGGTFFKGVPNLRLTGGMLGSIDNRKKGKNHWIIYFRRKDEELKASYHDHLGVGKRGSKTRPFFSLNDREQDHIEKMIVKGVDDLLRKI